MRRSTGLFAVIALVASILGFAVGAPAPAAAAGRDGSCQSGEFCYYYNSGNTGSVSDFTYSVADYGASQPTCYDFKSSGTGQGECIKNEAASVWNQTGKTVRVYFNSNFGGEYQDIPAGFKGQLDDALYNNNASHQILTSSGGGVRDGSCGDGEFCYYYNSGTEGSVSDFTYSVESYGDAQPTCYDFKGAGNGQGECIKNEAASVWNRSARTVRVYFNTGFEGAYQDIPAGYRGQLNSSLYNNNASHEFRGSLGSSGARNGSCDSGEFCYYYNSGNAGSISDFDASVGSYGNAQPTCYDFKGAGNGQSECIKNNAASVWNRSGQTVCVYFNSYYGGTSQAIAAGYQGQLNGSLYNNNASHRFTSASDCPVGGGGPGSGSGARDDKVERVIQAAESQIGQGLVYSWGGGGLDGPSYGFTSPSGSPDANNYGFDCSGLTQYAFWTGAGIDIGPSTYYQQFEGEVVPWSERQRGDLIFWGTHGGSTSHVAIYLGNNELLESAPTTPTGAEVGPYGRNSLNIHTREVYGGDFVLRVAGMGTDPLDRVPVEDTVTDDTCYTDMYATKPRYHGDSASKTYDRLFALGATNQVPASLYTGGYVPQGLAMLPNWNGSTEDVLLVSGYQNPDLGASSAIFGVVASGSRAGTSLGRVLLDNDGHVGGLGVFGQYVYVAHGSSLRAYEIADVVDGLTGSNTDTEIRATSVTPTSNPAVGFVGTGGGHLWAGDFSETEYTPVYRYTVLGGTSTGELEEHTTGTRAPIKTQGVAATADHFIFSTSLGNDNRSNVWVTGHDQGSPADANSYCFRAPSMSEGVTIHGGRLHIVYESAALVYQATAPRNVISETHSATVSSLTALTAHNVVD